MKTLNFKTSQQGYILGQKGEIENITYSDYLREFGGDETTTPRGIAPRLFIDGKDVMTYGIRGNNLATYKVCDTKKEAKNILLLNWEFNASENWDAPKFFPTKQALMEDLAGLHGRSIVVLKRYFRILDSRKNAFLKAKKEMQELKDAQPISTRDMIVNFINENKQLVDVLKAELDFLKLVNNQSDWQVKANALVQKVSNNDFRVLNWKEIYNLIKEK